jgi:predicted nucleic acid-binding protein
MIAIDTNVFIYSADDSDVAKHTIAKTLMLTRASAGDTVLLWQVASEFLRWLRRAVERGSVSQIGADLAFREVRDLFKLEPPSERILDIALDIYRRHSLSHWDSLLLAACIDVGIDTLYTEDLSHGVVYDGVTVLNPFIP